MSDPFSIVAGAAGILSSAITITHSLHDYYQAFRGQNRAISRLCSNLDGLTTTLLSLEKAMQSRDSHSDEQQLIQQVDKSIIGCREIAQELQEETAKIMSPAQPHTAKDILKAGSRRLSYPFRESTIQKLQEDIQEFRQNLLLALDVLQIQDAQQASKDIDEVKLVLDSVRATQLSNDIVAWLRAPDATTNHQDACAYKCWLQKPSWLWLTGFAGCGKSVLCSTAINATAMYKESKSKSLGICFFYFTFSDQSKQSAMDMLRSIVLQLSHQSDNGHKQLKALYRSIGPSSPSMASLLELFRSLLANFDDVYLFLDAIDESPLESHREQLLRVLSDIHTWQDANISVIITSRDHRDIRDVFSDIAEEVSMENDGVDEDIALWITDRLEQDQGLRRKWGAHQDRIKEVLTERAQGMFRWVECQFSSLLRTPVSKPLLEKMLAALPRTLDDTYRNMLAAIDSNLEEEAQRMLALLCSATRPLFAREIIDYLATDSDEASPVFDKDRRLQDENDLINICPGFLYVFQDYHEYLPARKLRIAHFSLQEYLVSDRLRRTEGVSRFYVDIHSAHGQVARASLAYLLGGTLSSYDQDPEVRVKYPFLGYSAFNWDHHYRCIQHEHRPTHLSYALVANTSRESLNWRAMLRKNRSNRYEAGKFPTSCLELASLLGLDDLVPSIIHNAKANTLSARSLLNQMEIDGFGILLSDYGSRINVHNETAEDDGRIGWRDRPTTALHTAVEICDSKIVEILLHHGMNPDVKGWTYYDGCGWYNGRPLSCALFNRDVVTTKLLLAHNADLESSLRKALRFGRDNESDSVRKNIDFLGKIHISLSGCSTDVRYNFIGTAIANQEVNLVKELLNENSDLLACPETESCLLDTAILTKSRSAEAKEIDEIISLLLQSLTSLAATDFCCGDGLTSCIKADFTGLALTLIERAEFDRGTVDSNESLKDSVYETVLRGFNDILERLLAVGMSGDTILHRLFIERQCIDLSYIPNFEATLKTIDTLSDGLTSGMRFLAASFLGEITTVQQIMHEDEAYLDFDLALAWAIRRGHIDLAKILRPHATDQEWALIEVCRSHKLEYLELFEDYFRRLHVERSAALHFATQAGFRYAVQKLLEAGADPNEKFSNLRDIIPKCYFGNAELGYWLDCKLHPPEGWPAVPAKHEGNLPLAIACKQGNHEIIMLLLQYGADVNVRDINTLLKQVNIFDISRSLTMLLERVADIDDDGDEGKTLLEYAVDTHNPKNLRVVQLLCDAGADLEHNGYHPHKEQYQTPLAFAVDKRNKDIINFLLDRGAVINYQVLEATCGNPELLSLVHLRKRIREEAQSAALEEGQ